MAYAQMGVLDQALVSLSEAVRLNPGDAAAYEGLAVAFEAVGRSACVALVEAGQGQAEGQTPPMEFALPNDTDQVAESPSRRDGRPLRR